MLVSCKATKILYRIVSVQHSYAEHIVMKAYGGRRGTHIIDHSMHIYIEWSALDSDHLMKCMFIRLFNYITLLCLLAVTVIWLLIKFTII
jgi:hypothetical protein